MRVGHEGRHALRGGLVEVIEHKVAAEQVRGVVVHGLAEELREDDFHDKQREQRVEHAPQHAEHRTLVLGLKVSRHQFLEQKLVLL